MAKLAIYRGETLEREIELGPRTARIGRGDQNEIVLTDPAKSVSRFHAELRYEDGRYTIVDLNSQNGTWVAGKRVAQTVLEPGVPVVVGTYRLVFVGEAAPAVDAEKTMISGPAPAAAPPAAAPAPAPAAAPAAPRPAPAPAAPKPEAVAAPAPAPVAKKEEPKPAAPAAPPPAPKPAAAPPTPPPPAPAAKPAAPSPAPKPAAAPPPAPPKPVAPPPAAAKPLPPPAAAAAAKPPEPAKPAAAKPAGKGFPKVAILVVFVLLVLGAVGAGIFLWRPAGSATPAPSPASQAASPASSQPAPAQPAAAAEQQQPAAPPAEPPAPTARPKSEQPAVTRAESEARAPKAAKTVPKDPVGEAAAVPVPSKKADRRRGGAEPAPAPARPRDLGAMLAQARSAMIKGDYLAAVSNLEAIVKVDPKYQDAAQMLDMAKSGARNAAQLAVDSGAKAEMAGDYDTAIKQYEQAQQLDPGSQPAADAMRRVHGRMQADGEEAFKRAKQFDALGRSSDAIAMYEKAIKLLPADHASAKTAKERLAALRGGE